MTERLYRCRFCGLTEFLDPHDPFYCHWCGSSMLPVSSAEREAQEKATHGTP